MYPHVILSTNWTLSMSSTKTRKQISTEQKVVSMIKKYIKKKKGKGKGNVSKQLDTTNLYIFLNAKNWLISRFHCTFIFHAFVKCANKHKECKHNVKFLLCLPSSGQALTTTECQIILNYWIICGNIFVLCVSISQVTDLYVISCGLLIRITIILDTS